MIEHRPFARLGRFENAWLNAHYHFSFSGYRDPNRMGWGKLRVWNDDEIRAGAGFDPHPHRDMEIITYVRRGAITHSDSLGNEGRTEAGDVQVMSAGSGVTHAERNLEDETTTLFQIWIEPAEHGGPASWAAAKFPKADRAGELVVLASGRPGDDALPIRQDARVLAATLQPGQTARYALEPGRKAYVALAEGAVDLGELRLGPRDGAAIADVEEIVITGVEAAELVMVDTL